MNGNYIIKKILGSTRSFLLFVSLIALFLLLGVGVAYFFAQRSDRHTVLPGAANLPATGDESEFGTNELQKLSVNAQLQVNGRFYLAPSTLPDNAAAGTLVFDQATSTLQYFNGSSFVPLVAQEDVVFPEFPTVDVGVTSLQGQTGAITLVPGPGIQINGTTISNSGLLGVNGVPGDISVTTANGIASLSLPQSIAPTASPTFANLAIDGDVVLTTGGSIYTNQVSQVAPGQNVTIDAGSDDIIFNVAGRTFQLPTTGPAAQTICTTGITCVAGGGQSVMLAPGSAQTDNTPDVSIFVNDTGGGNLLQLQAGGTNRFVVAANGDTAVGGTLNINTLRNSTGGNATVVGFLPPVANTTLNLPALSAGTYEICTSGGNCPGVTAVDSLNGLNGALTLANASGVGSTITINDASTSTKGIAQFNATNFSVAGGVVNTIQSIATSASPTFNGLTLTNALTVANGGTGRSSLTLNSVLVGNGAGQVQQVSAGGAGQCLVSTAGAPIFAACPGAGGVASVNGQTGAVTINNASGSGGAITINDASTSAKGIAQFNSTNFSVAGGVVNTIQSIATTASPTFAGLSLSAPLAVSSGGTGAGTFTAGGILFGNGTGAFTTSGVLSNGQLLIGDGSGAPTAATLTQGSGIVITNGAGSITVAIDNTVCTTAGNCAGVGGMGDITGAGTAGRLTVFDAAKNIVNSTLLQGTGTLTLDNGSDFVIAGGDLSVTGAGSFTGRVSGADAVNNNEFVTLSQLNDAVGGVGGVASLNTLDGALVLSVTSGHLTVSDNGTNQITFGLPNSGVAADSYGSASQVATFTVDAQGRITAAASSNIAINANQVTGGTLDDDRLSSNVALLDTAANFTGVLQQGGDDVCTTAGNCAGVGGMGDITGAGTAGRLTVFDAAKNIVNSTLLQGTGTLTLDNGSDFVIAGGDLSVTGAGSFTGRVSGADAVNNNEFVTLSQLNDAVGGVGGAGVTTLNSLSGVLSIQGAAGQVVIADNGTNTITVSLDSSVTMQGNTFNGAEQLVLLNSSGALPVLSGVNLTNLNAANIASGTLNDDRLSSNVALLNANANFTGALQQGGDDVCTTAGNCAGVGGVGDITGTGTANRLAMFDAAKNITVSTLLQGAGTLTLDAGNNLVVAGGNLSVTGSGSFTGRVSGADAVNNDEFTTLSQLNAAVGGVDVGVTTLNDLAGDLNVQGTAGQLSVTDNATDTITISLDSSVTLQGNTFNGAEQLVQLNSSGALPVLSGVNLTNLNATNIASGTLDNARLSADVALYNAATANFTGALQQDGDDVCTTAGNCAGVGGVGDITGTGTANRLAMFDAAKSIVISALLQGTGSLTLDSGSDLVIAGGDVIVSGSGSFTGRVSGADAVNNDEFTTLSQLNAAVGGVGGAGVTALNSLTGSLTIQGSAGQLTVADNGTTTITLSLDSSVTLQGNTFNGAGQLVQLNGSGQLPAVSGINLTSLNATNIASGTLNDGRLSSNVALLDTNANFTGALQQDGDDVCTTAGNCAGVGGVGDITGTGSANRLAMFDAAKNITISTLLQGTGTLTLDSGNDLVLAGGNLNVSGSGSFTGRVSGADAVNNNEFTTLSQLNDAVGGVGGAGVTSLNSQTGAVTINNANAIGGTITIHSASTVDRGIARFNATNFSVSSGTVNTIQSIATSATPTFAGLTLSAPLSVSSGGTGANTFIAGGILLGNGTGAFTTTGVLSNGQLLIGDGSGAPTAATLTQGSGIVITNGAGSISVAVDNTVCTTAGNCAGVGGVGDITGTGTANRLAMFDAAKNIVISTLLQGTGTLTLDSGNDLVLAGGNLNVSGSGSFTGRVSGADAVNNDEFTTLSQLNDAVGGVGGGVTTIGTLDSQAKSANGAVITGANLVMQTADGTYPGLVSTGAQTFAGNKTFTGSVLTSTIDRASAGTLSIGTTTASTLTLGRAISGTTNIQGGNVNLSGNTNVASGSSFTVVSGEASITGRSTGSNTALRVNNHTSTGNIFVAQDAGTDVFTIADGGGVTAAGNLTVGGSVRFSSLTNCIVLETDSSGNVSCGTGGAGGVDTVGTINSLTKSANGAVISGDTIVLQTADATYPGLVSTGTQTFAGDKTFSGMVYASWINDLQLENSSGEIWIESAGANSGLRVDGHIQLGNIITPIYDMFGDLTVASNGTSSTLSLQAGSGGINLNTTNGGNIAMDTNTLYVDTTNNRVGIGTSSPSQKLYVQDTVNGAVGIYVGNASTDANAQARFSAVSATSQLTFSAYPDTYTLAPHFADRVAMFGETSAQGINIATLNSNGDIRFMTGGSDASDERAIINNTGLGIGTSNPQASLHVDGTIRFEDLTNCTVLETDGSGNVGCGAGGSGGISAIGTIDSQTKSANGAVVSGNNLVLQTADATNPGLVSTGAQTFAGQKTFIDSVLIQNSTNSATALLVNNATGQSILQVDTNYGGVVLSGSTLSTGGEVWTSRTSAADNDWTSVAYGNGIFVAVASSGSGNRVMTSTNGINWVTRATDDDDYRGVTYGNGLFVAVASAIDGDRIMTSPDGITWTPRTAPNTNYWNAVTYGDGMFVGVAAVGIGHRVMSSPDGITWTGRSPTGGVYSSVTYGNGMYVAVGSSGVITSPDGITWTSRTPATANNWRSVTYGNGLFVAVSSDGAGDRVMTSPDGINWDSQASAADNVWRSVTYGNGLFVAVSGDGTGNRVMTSPDGINWDSQASAADNYWTSVAYGNGTFVAVSLDGTGNRVMTSSAGSKSISLRAMSGIEVAGSSIFNGNLTTMGNMELYGSLRVSGPTRLNGQVTIGNNDASGTLLVLDTKNTAGDPSGINGGMYYNSDAGKFRCYEGGSWMNCISSGITTVGTFVAANSYANGATVSGSDIILGSATASNPGIVNNTTQTFGGQKTFANGIISTGTTDAYVDINRSSTGAGATGIRLGTGGGFLWGLYAPVSSTDFRLMNSATYEDVLSITQTGQVTFENSSNSTTALRVNSSSGNAVLTVNTTTPGIIVDGALSVAGNTTLGDASGDSLTLNGINVATPNNLNFDSGTLYLDATNNRIGIGTTSTTHGVLTVTGTAPNQQNGSQLLVYGSLTSTTNSQSGIFADISVSPASASSAAYLGMGSYLSSSSNNLANAQLKGIYSGVEYSGTATLDDLLGLQLERRNSSSGTINTSRGIEVQDLYNTGTVVDNFGIAIANQTSGTNNYGLYIQGASTYAMWVDSGTSLLGGDVIIGERADSGGTTSDWALASGTGDICGTTGVDAVLGMVEYNGSLYVGTRKSNSAELCRYDGGTSWTRINPAPGTFGAQTQRDAVSAMTVYNGHLYVTVDEGLSGNAAALYRYDGGTTFTLINTTLGRLETTTDIDFFNSLQVANGMLYIGTREGGAAEVYRYNPSAGVTGTSVFTRVNSTAGNICGTGSVSEVADMVLYNNQLYAGTYFGTSAEICRYDGGTSWTRVNHANAGSIGSQTAVTGFQKLIAFNGSLYAFTDKAGVAELYRYAGGTSWQVMNGTPGTWNTTTGHEAVLDAFEYNGQLYFSSLLDNTNSLEVYRYDAGQNTFTRISSSTPGTIIAGGTAGIDFGEHAMAVHDGSLFMGTFESGRAEVYRFNESEGLSYGLKFRAVTDNAGTTLQGGRYNEGQIQFNAEYGMNGSFLFSHSINTTSGSYDIAEDYPTRDDTLKPGDLVSIDPNEAGFVRKSFGPGDPGIVGIYSTKPALRIGQQGDTINGGRAIPVALAGRVPVKVSTENGAIAAGDPLAASSIPGVAMKARAGDRIVGMAMQPYTEADPSVIGEVVVFVNPSWYGVTDQQYLQMLTVENLQVTGTLTTENLVVYGTVTITELSVVNITASGNLVVEGDVSVQRLFVGTRIISQGDAPEVIKGAILGASDLANIEGNDIAGTVTVSIDEGTVLNAGDELVSVRFVNRYDSRPRVVLTPATKDAAQLEFYVERNEDGFVIKLSVLPPQGTVLEFDYQIIQ